LFILEYYTFMHLTKIRLRYFMIVLIFNPRSNLQRSNRLDSGEKPVRYAVSSLGWVPIAEEDLTPERSNKAVNKCIMDLTLGRNNVNDGVGRWGDVRTVFCSYLISAICSFF